jgi:hypothetical protein
MRRISILAVLLSVVLGGLLIVGRASTIGAQDSTPAAMDGHPLVGTWLLDTDAENAGNPPTLATFGADGIYSQVEADGAVGVGAWQATGGSTADLTFHELDSENGNYSGMVTIRAAITVAADGQSLTATYTGEYVTADGLSTGQYGPGSATGTKLVAEPMGTPEGPLSALFGEATPEATPGT